MKDNTINQQNNDSKKDDLYQYRPSHYESAIDLIEFFRLNSTEEEFRGAMRFTIMKYAHRLGKKDAESKEYTKIIDYAQRAVDALNK